RLRTRGGVPAAENGDATGGHGIRKEPPPTMARLGSGIVACGIVRLLDHCTPPFSAADRPDQLPGRLGDVEPRIAVLPARTTASVRSAMGVIRNRLPTTSQSTLHGSITACQPCQPRV